MVKKSSKKRKYFNSTVTTAVVASTVLGVTPAGAADLNYSDVKATDYFYDSIKSLADRGIVKGFPDGLFKPYASVTRGQAAVMLANLLQLDTKNVKNPGFTDVPTTHPYYGAIAALSAKGIINGYEDKTYRPSDPIKRQHIALIIANAFQLKAQNPTSLPFTDVLPAYKEKVAALYENGVTSGTSPTTFNSNANVTRGQIATFIVKAEEATAYTELTIEGISNNTIQTNKGTYTSTSNTTTIFSTENTNALIGATVKVKIEGNQITEVNALTLNASGTADDPKVFNGKNATITGLTINADNIQVKNLTVNGDIQVTNKVATEFNLEKVVTKGQLILGSATNSVASTNTLFAAQTTGPKINLIGTEIEGLLARLNNLNINSDTKIPAMTIDVGVSNIQVAGEIGKVVINVNVKVELSGDVTIDKLLVGQAAELALKIAGEVKQLIIENSSAKVEVGTDVKVETLTVPSNTNPQNVITNYNSISKNISNVKDANGNKIDTPKGSSGGGSRDRDNNDPADTVAPNVSVISNIVLIGQNLSVQSNESGTVYLTSSDTALTTINDLEKNAIVKSTVETANSYVKINTTDLQEGEYQLYVVDKANNISTVTKISLVDTPEEYIAGKIEELELLVYGSVGEHDGTTTRISELAEKRNKEVDEFTIEIAKESYVILMGLLNYSEVPPINEIDFQLTDLMNSLSDVQDKVSLSSTIEITGEETDEETDEETEKYISPETAENLLTHLGEILTSIEFDNLSIFEPELNTTKLDSTLKVASRLVTFLNEENTELAEFDSEIVAVVNYVLPYLYIMILGEISSNVPYWDLDNKDEVLKVIKKYLYNEYFSSLFTNQIFKNPNVAFDELELIDSIEEYKEKKAVLNLLFEEAEISSETDMETFLFIILNLQLGYVLGMGQYTDVNERFYKANELLMEKYLDGETAQPLFPIIIEKMSEDQFLIKPFIEVDFNTDPNKKVNLLESLGEKEPISEDSTFIYSLDKITDTIEITTNDSITISEDSDGIISLEVTDEDGSLSGFYSLVISNDEIDYYDIMIYVSDSSEITHSFIYPIEPLL